MTEYVERACDKYWQSMEMMCLQIMCGWMRPGWMKRGVDVKENMSDQKVLEWLGRVIKVYETEVEGRLQRSGKPRYRSVKPS